MPKKRLKCSNVKGKVCFWLLGFFGAKIWPWFETDFVRVDFVIRSRTQQLPPKPRAKQTRSSFGLNLKSKAALLLEKGNPPPISNAMQGVQEMQQAIVCSLRRKEEKDKMLGKDKEVENLEEKEERN